MKVMKIAVKFNLDKKVRSVLKCELLINELK